MFLRRKKGTKPAHYKTLVSIINDKGFKSLSDYELKQQISDYKERYSKYLHNSNENFNTRDSQQFINEYLTKCYAITKEICRRVLGLDPYDSQLLTGIALYFGKIAELPTGEGKTLAAVFPAVLNALSGKGAHILTFNDYLAKRDAQWMKDIYEFWGLKAAYIQEDMDRLQRRNSYLADITYVTPKEAGFDYLRDSIVYDKDEIVHRPFNSVIVDEADAILIDEARTPLVLAGSMGMQHEIDKGLLELAGLLRRNIDYMTDENSRNVYLTETGAAVVENFLGCGNLYNKKNVEILTDINNLLHAKVLLKQDIDYIIKDGRIEIIDEFTGRVAERRKWDYGLQRSLEALKGIKSTSSNRILGKITIQNFISLYPEMSGMTATAKSSEDEFRSTYKHDVYVVQPNKKCIRTDYDDYIYTHKEAKYKAVVEEVLTSHNQGRPVLIGTSNIRESEKLAYMLKQQGIECEVLNAKNDTEEAKIIALAGKLGAVTVSTNMAGRGVDIKLGGDSPEERKKVSELGGLYVIGTNRNECVRIDNQLRGRAGRQGDPGSSRFFISLEDDLLVQFGIKKVIPVKYCGFRQLERINDKKLLSLIYHIQRVVNGQNFEIRKTLGKYSYLLEWQRRRFMKSRFEVLSCNVPGFLAIEKKELYKELCSKYGKERVDEIQRKVSLHCMDEVWYDFLEYLENIKEGINLVSAGRKDPVDEFNKLSINKFEQLQEDINEKILNTLDNIDFSMDASQLADRGLQTPSATWTYIINDSIKVKNFTLFSRL
ncbi:accessory Sec system translocase SecA2 [Ruminiclostridium cellulolyticum]|uniref:Protein translocase subunit SecA n=1 Tax=Ruminiclostridium cellulolyticum (strain ATCC 35319 / DSM 5812 / JCM 6584 / H10) TaxID=394503 RepID=B8I4V4_RUMCH|nr:accessory Sec system translocase SecA2 [Ruminiclostridium cellulolyticum]ACL76608.1 SecA DEAD domain protein [Ruminiclostridium cellulolyticum H10]